MEQFYTKQVSKEIFKALLNKHYPAENIPVGYFAFENGGGYVEHGQKIPTYAEVLDWLLTNGYTFSIGNVEGGKKWFALAPFCKSNNMSGSFKETLEKVILLALDLMENE